MGPTITQRYCLNLINSASAETRSSVLAVKLHMAMEKLCYLHMTN